MTMEKEPQLTVLLQEYGQVTEAIRHRTSNNEKVMGFGLTVVVATFTVGLKESVFEVFLFIPVALLWLIAYIIYLYTEVMIYGGYCKHIEHKVNKLCDDQCLKFESHLSPYIHHKFANYSVQVVGFAASIIVIALCLGELYDSSTTLFWWYTSIYSALVALTLVGAAKVYGTYDKIFKLSEMKDASYPRGASEQRRIVIFAPQMPPQHGGVAQTVLRIANELSKDNEIWLLVPRPHDALAAKIQKRASALLPANVHLQFLPSRRHSFLTRAVLGDEVLDMAYFVQHHRKLKHSYILESIRPDAVFVVDPTAFAGMPLIGGYRKPIAVDYCETHDVPLAAYYHSHFVGAVQYYPLPIRMLFTAPIRFYTRKSLRPYRNLIVFSSYMYAQLVDLGVRHARKLSIEGLEMEKWVQSHTARRSDDGILRIIYFGRLMREKNIIMMAAVLRELGQSDVRFRVTIIGSGPEKAKLSTLRGTVEIELIEWLEHEELIQHIVQADAYINCTSFETLCLSMAESMSLGCIPVVCSQGGHTELVTHGVDGFLCSSVTDYVSALTFLYRNSSARTEMANAARQRITREFDLQKNIANLRHALTLDRLPPPPRRESVSAGDSP